MKEKIRIGCGAGFSGDRLEPAVVLVEKGKLDYLVLECLAERTIALAQKRKMADPTKGYDPFLERRIESLLPLLIKNNVRLITNMGAANPIAGARKIVEIAKKLGVKVKVAAVTGDELGIRNKELGIEKQLDFNDFQIFGIEIKGLDLVKNEFLIPNSQSLISANAYLGVEGILEALKFDAQIIITGRVADPSLFLAPMIHEFGWATDDYDLMGKGTVIGHLLECAGHITGGYFADPVKKPIENMENLGHPFVDIFPDGSAIISKVEGTGGVVNLQTAKEQLLYEVVNPHEYYTPDVVANFTTVELKKIAQNKVLVTGGTGKEKPKALKVSIGYRAFWQGEGEISYYGPSAMERAELAAEIMRKRSPQIASTNRPEGGINTEILSKNSPSGGWGALRVAAKCSTKAEAELIGEEVEALYTNGPAGGGGVRKYVNEVIGIASVLVDREAVKAKISIFSTNDLETERLILKPTDIDDAAFILEIYNSPKWLKNIGDRNVRTVADAENFIREKHIPNFEKNGFGNYTIVEKASQERIGICGIYSRPELVGFDLGFAFLPNFEGKGFGFESATRLLEAAKDDFQLKELAAIANIDNHDSHKLLLKLGFEFIEDKIIRENDEVKYFKKTL